MKRLCLVLAMLLGLVLVPACPAWAGILPGEYLDGPTGGSGDGGNDGEDGDHPWGGDRIIGGGETTPDKYVVISTVTGYFALDLLINQTWLSFQTNTKTVTSSTTSENSLEDRSYRSTSTRRSSAFYAKGGRR